MSSLPAVENFPPRVALTPLVYLVGLSQQSDVAAAIRLAYRATELNPPIGRASLVFGLAAFPEFRDNNFSTGFRRT
jgi:hypothetical protein